MKFDIFWISHFDKVQTPVIKIHKYFIMPKSTINTNTFKNFSKSSKTNNFDNFNKSGKNKNDKMSKKNHDNLLVINSLSKKVDQFIKNPHKILIDDLFSKEPKNDKEKPPMYFKHAYVPDTHVLFYSQNVDGRKIWTQPYAGNSFFEISPTSHAGFNDLIDTVSKLPNSENFYVVCPIFFSQYPEQSVFVDSQICVTTKISREENINKACCRRLAEQFGFVPKHESYLNNRPIGTGDYCSIMNKYLNVKDCVPFKSKTSEITPREYIYNAILNKCQMFVYGTFEDIVELFENVGERFVEKDINGVHAVRLIKLSYVKGIYNEHFVTTDNSTTHNPTTDNPTTDNSTTDNSTDLPSTTTVLPADVITSLTNGINEIATTVVTTAATAIDDSYGCSNIEDSKLFGKPIDHFVDNLVDDPEDYSIDHTHIENNKSIEDYVKNLNDNLI